MSADVMHVHVEMPADGKVSTLESAIAHIAQVDDCRVHREFRGGVCHYRLVRRERQVEPTKVVDLASRRRDFWPAHPQGPGFAA